MDIIIKVNQDSESILESQKIRKKVFVQEQGIPLALDLDGRDDDSYHALAFTNNQVVGIARLSLVENNNAVLARVAVQKEFRGLGVASRVVNASLLKAENLSVKKISIHPHEHLRRFYESFGFKYIEESEVVGSHQLIRMEKVLGHYPS